LLRLSRKRRGGLLVACIVAAKEHQHEALGLASGKLLADAIQLMKGQRSKCE